MQPALTAATAEAGRQEPPPAPPAEPERLRALMGFRIWDVPLPQAARYIVDCARRGELLDVYFVNGYLPAEHEAARLEALNASGARILFVAKGVPAQEHWIAAHRAQLRVPVVLGVGACLDFHSGAVRRAPPLVRRLRSEWVWRLLREPRRMSCRYLLGIPEFLARALLHRVWQQKA